MPKAGPRWLRETGSASWLIWNSRFSRCQKSCMTPSRPILEITVRLGFLVPTVSGQTFVFRGRHCPYLDYECASSKRVQLVSALFPAPCTFPPFGDQCPLEINHILENFKQLIKVQTTLFVTFVGTSDAKRKPHSSRHIVIPVCNDPRQEAGKLPSRSYC